MGENPIALCPRGLHTGQSSVTVGVVLKSSQLGKVSNLVIVEAFQVFLFQQDLDALLDVGNLGCEPGTNLVDAFAHKVRVLHLLAGLHDSYNGRLESNVSVRSYPWKARNVSPYLHEKFAILLNSLVCIIDLLLLLCLDSNIQVDADLLVLELVIELESRLRLVSGAFW